MKEQFELYGFVWKDATNYNRNDKERKPTSWETSLGDVRVYITCGHVAYRPDWIFTCHALGFGPTCIEKAKTKEDAAEYAIKTCRDKVRILYAMFFNHERIS